jgi:hypothetical protein
MTAGESPDLEPGGLLTTTNGAIHHGHEEALLSLIESLTSLDIPRAAASQRALDADLEAHLALEDATSHRRYAELGDHPRGAAPELFTADHVSLAKVMATCREALADLVSPGENLRRRVVLALPTFYRLRNVLEHHTLREQRFLYPRLDEVLEADAVAAMARALTSPEGS